MLSYDRTMVSLGSSWTRMIAVMVLVGSCITVSSQVSAIDPTMPLLFRVRLFAHEPIVDLHIHSTSPLLIGRHFSAKTLHLYLRHGRFFLGASPLHTASITCLSPDGMDLVLPNGMLKTTTGSLDIYPRGKQLLVINNLDLESYVLGVAGPELGRVSPRPESVKAQMVASRSYALAMRGRHHKEGYDFCDGPHCQVFGGLRTLQPGFREVLNATHGQFLAYHDRPIPAFFHDSCGGATASAHDIWKIADVPYLHGTTDGLPEPYCRAAPHAHWSFSINRLKLQACLEHAGLWSSHDQLKTIRVNQRDPSGRALQLKITGTRLYTLSGPQFARAMNRAFGDNTIPSLLFILTRRGNQYYITGRGWGHGVGMCQWGAMEMAKEGQTYRQILAHYYPGSKLESMDNAVYADAEGFRSPAKKNNRFTLLPS